MKWFRPFSGKIYYIIFIILKNFNFFYLKIEETCKNYNFNVECVFWNYTLDEWSPDGCSYKELEKNGTIVHKCSCNHLSNFAILFVPQNSLFPFEIERFLSISSITGISVSILSLSITILNEFLL